MSNRSCGLIYSIIVTRSLPLTPRLSGAGVNILFDDELVAEDFHLPNKSCVLYVSEGDIIAGNSYRRKVVRFRNVSEAKRQRRFSAGSC